MDDTANNLAETPELAQSDAPEAQPTEQPETDQSSDDAPDLTRKNRPGVRGSRV